jgi:cyclophilin family peptidyl-prolyl cis-trans isomerase
VFALGWATLEKGITMHRVLLVSTLGLLAASLACDSGSASEAQTKEAPAKVVGIQAIDDFIALQKIDKSSADWKTDLPKPPEVAFDDKTYFWDVETNVGKIVIKLMPGVAPMHVSNLIYLTRLGFYDGTPFHRVIPGFMAQGGCPIGNGRGNPGYRFGGEFDASVRHDRPGLLSMANAGPGTDGSQFFITFVPTPHLNDKHTIYGEVVEGMETVQQLEARQKRGSPQASEPLEIKKATVRAE